MSDDNYYEELGVEPGASRDELREAHRQRIADLEAAREKKNVSDSQLQANRDEVARVRAAWNVLSDPFQRQRYDAQLGRGSPSRRARSSSSTTTRGSAVERCRAHRLAQAARAPAAEGRRAPATATRTATARARARRRVWTATGVPVPSPRSCSPRG